jgi:imidazolonepropionase
MRVDRIWRNARLMTMEGAGLGLVEDGVLAEAGGRILYAGPIEGAPSLRAKLTVDCEGRWITPGLVDCHTHLVFGGDRSGEWQARLAGASYTELASIGGIRATVAATREASDQQLLASALTRLDAMLAQGVTTIEVKSGYGLDTPTELRQLHIARALGHHRGVRVVTSLLAAHALPPEAASADAYIDTVLAELLPQARAQGLADAVDAFCETIAFTAPQIARLFEAATAAGLRVKLHADQLSDGGGAALAAQFHALSADHLEYTSPAGVRAMAEAGTVAVLLPGAFHVLRERQLPPVGALRAAGVPIAVATDCNPGTAPLLSPLLAMNLAATLFGLTVEECLRGMTCNAARALGLQDQLGTLAPGQRADLAVWSIDQPAELIYWMGSNSLWRREFAA